MTETTLKRLDEGAAYSGYPEGFAGWQKLCGDAASEIRRLQARLAQAEAALDTWDDEHDARYWMMYPRRIVDQQLQGKP